MNALRKEDLDNFTGTVNWYRHSLVRNITYTDGVKHLADNGGAYWLIDEVAFAQRTEPSKVGREPFQSWKLKVSPSKSATLICEDGNGNEIHRKLIAYTDFPLDEIEVWFTDNVILLPSEY